jgi:hypothetical protein
MAGGRWERRGRGTRAINVQAVVGSGGGDEVARDGGGEVVASEPKKDAVVGRVFS